MCIQPHMKDAHMLPNTRQARRTFLLESGWLVVRNGEIYKISCINVE